VRNTSEEGVPPTLPRDATPSSCVSRSLRLESDGIPKSLELRLRAMKLTALIKRAGSAGVTEEEMDAAEDEDDHKSALIKLILDKEIGIDSNRSNESNSDADAALVAALRAELGAMKITKLIARSATVGIVEEELEAAEDEDDYKGAVIELILQREVGQPADGSLSLAAHPIDRTKDMLHFGQSPGASNLPQADSSANWVMFSYNWDHQEIVKRTYDLLTKLGVPCWMDITGGMGSDIYDSMAEGNSFAFVQTSTSWCAFSVCVVFLTHLCVTHAFVPRCFERVGCGVLHEPEVPGLSKL
jgi:hypothetical protein